MTGRTKSVDDEFLIGGNGITAAIPGLIGIAFLGAGIMIIETVVHLGHALIGLGMTVLSLGMYFFLRSRNYRIRIDTGKKSITIVETGFRKRNRIEISTDKYSGILVQPRMDDGKAAGTAIRYDVMLMSDQGSTLLFSEHKNEEEAMALARGLHFEYGFSLHVDDELSRLFKVKRQGGKVKTGIEPGVSGAVSITRRGNTVSLTWKAMRDPFIFFSLLVGIYGVIHMVVFTAIPLMTESSLVYLFYAGIALAALIAILFIIVTLFGTYILEFIHDRVNYHVRMLGVRLGERSMKVNSIVLVKNCIGRGNGTIQVVSERGLIAIMRMIELVKKKGIQIADLSILGEVAVFNNESIQISVASLPLSDRLYIEDMLLGRMAESD